MELYNTVLHDPKMRDPRGYIIPSDQADFANATEFVNALLKTGITVPESQRRVSGGRQELPGRLVRGEDRAGLSPARHGHVRAAGPSQRFAYPGGPPNPPYDITGWTLAMQMGVEFDRVQRRLRRTVHEDWRASAAPASSISGPSNPAGYLISHRINNSFVLINRLMKAGADVYWLKKQEVVDGQDLGTGAIWVPASPLLGRCWSAPRRNWECPCTPLAQAPAGDALKLKPIRIGCTTSTADRCLPAGRAGCSSNTSCRSKWSTRRRSMPAT
jgi:hypothetical protein